MTEKALSLYTLAKYANQELLLESLLQAKGSYQSLFLERYKKRKRALKIKVIGTKILYSIIFGLLPVLLILTYLEIIRNLDLYPFSSENIILTGVVFFGLYFVLQFFNFFLMGLLESSMVMSGIIFSWFETLPIPRERLKKLAYITIFRSFDIPIIFIVFGFPITMLIQTQNLLAFFISLGISSVNIIFSFDLLILFGERLHRVLYSNKTSPKKALAVRLFNIFSYMAVILGTIYIIQWVFASINQIFGAIIFFEQPLLLNIILSTLPYPFNPSYILSIAITPSQITPNLLVSTTVGLGLFILITYVIHKKTSKILTKVTNASSMEIQSSPIKEEIQVKVKTRAPVSAFLHKDLSVASHDVKVFLSLVMPTILSCIFTFSFNFGITFSPISLTRDIVIYSFGIILFCPIIASMLVYAISSIDLSGETILAALPIVQRERVKAKLIIMIVLQSLALFSPPFIFLLTPKFSIFFIATLIMAPFVLIFLILTYELKIYYFNKFGKRYVIGDINPQKRLFKWTLIICIQYVIDFWILSFVLIFFIFQLISTMTVFFVIVNIILILVVDLTLNKMFPFIKEKKKLEPVKNAKPTFFSRHKWISLIVISVLYFINLTLSILILIILVYSYFIPYYGYDIINLIGVMLFNLSLIPLFFIIIPKVLGLPYGRQRIKQYLNGVKANWLKQILKILLWVILGFVIITIIGVGANLIFSASPIFLISIESLLFLLTLNFSIYFWNELFFRGLILTMFLRTIKKFYAILLNAFVVTVFNYIIVMFSPLGFMYFDLFILFPMIFYFTIIFITHTFLAYLCVKTNTILPGIIIQAIMSVIAIPGITPLFSFFPFYYIYPFHI
ncbi:MAG: type II CAAX prenyl endopeptidase Rce1 family protein [Candidatus Odinarchaeota archaeon]